MGDTVYKIVTDQILDKLENGDIPWHKPWVSESPKNLISKKEYRGINTFLLSLQKYNSPYWVSYKQAQELGGNVKKGQKSTLVVFWKQVKIKDKENEESKTIPLLRYYRIFNVSQCEGFENKIPAIDVNPNFQSIPKCENTVSNMQKKPDIRNQDQRAYYSPLDDFVNMPNKESFGKEEFYYSTLFHELGHSTGHKTRLNRKGLNTMAAFGSTDYSKEELIAEMTAAFLCGQHRIEQSTIDNSTAYIKSWLKVLKNDVKMVVVAAAQAQKASDYILNKI